MPKLPACETIAEEQACRQDTSCDYRRFRDRHNGWLHEPGSGNGVGKTGKRKGNHIGGSELAWGNIFKSRSPKPSIPNHHLCISKSTARHCGHFDYRAKNCSGKVLFRRSNRGKGLGGGTCQQLTPNFRACQRPICCPKPSPCRRSIEPNATLGWRVPIHSQQYSEKKDFCFHDLISL